MDNYKAFQKCVYQYLTSYKEENITKECGTYKGEKRKEFLPESYWNEEVPAMLYSGIRETVKDIQKSEFRYKPHLFAFKHVASSQTACINLFVPILESEHVNEILKSIDACPKDFKEINRDALKNGYRFEFWDSTDENDKGLLGDHSKQAEGCLSGSIAPGGPDCRRFPERRCSRRIERYCTICQVYDRYDGGRDIQRCFVRLRT